MRSNYAPELESTAIASLAQLAMLGDNLPYIDLGSNRAVRVGDSSKCAQLDNYEVKCWGNNWSGELGLGDTLARTEPAAMGDNLPYLDLL